MSPRSTVIVIGGDYKDTDLLALRMSANAEND